MAFKLTIAPPGGSAVDKTSLIRQTDKATITLPLNARATAHFTCLPTLIPARFSEVVFYAQDGTTPIFGGVITRRSIRPLHDYAAPSLADIDCGDYSTYADGCYTNLSYSGTVQLETVLADLVTEKLGAHGITYTPVTTGSALAPFSWSGSNKRVSDALRELSDKTGWVFTVSPAKALTMSLLGSVAAPYNLSDATPHCRELTWADSDYLPSNKVIVTCGPSGAASLTQVWTANGTDTSWVTSTPAAGLDPTHVTVGGAIKVVGAGEAFTWDNPTHTLGVGTDPTPAYGTVISLVYIGLFPFVVTASAAGSPVIEYLSTAPDVTTVAAGQELADGLLAKLNQAPREITVLTNDQGWAPGQALTVALSARSVTGAFMITQVSIELVTAQTWHYTLTATETTTYQGNWLDQWRTLTGGGGSTSAGSTTVSGATSTDLAAAVAVPVSVSLAVTTTEQGTNVSPNTALAVAQAVRRRLSTTRLVGVSLQVRARVLSPEGGTVTLHLRDVTNSLTVGSSTAMALTAGVVTEIIFSVTPTTGTADYELWWEATTAPINLSPGSAVLESL
jgi:hypothetical protein